jgi:hypothetical protein
MDTNFWLQNLKEKLYLKDTGIDGRIIVKCNKDIR